MELYGIEKKRFWYHETRFRWYSKYNGARGPWCYYKHEAEQGGVEHANIIRTFFAKEEIDNSTQQNTTDASQHLEY